MSDLREGPPQRARYPLFRSLTTRWMDNDVYGHLNNVVHYSLFDTTVNGALIEAGVLDPPAGPVIGLVVETGCRYFSPLAFPDVIEAGVVVEHLGGSSVRYGVGLFRAGEAEAAAAGRFVHVYVDRDTRRPVPLPASLRSLLETWRIP